MSLLVETGYVCDSTLLLPYQLPPGGCCDLLRLPERSLICSCGLGPTLHARGCLARGVFFAGHLAPVHRNSEGYLWEKRLAVTQIVSDRFNLGVCVSVIFGEGGCCGVSQYVVCIIYIYGVRIVGTGLHALWLPHVCLYMIRFDMWRAVDMLYMYTVGCGCLHSSSFHYTFKRLSYGNLSFWPRHVLVSHV